MPSVKSTPAAFQDQMPGNHCFGCGPDNPDGLRIKSYWADGSDEAVCEFQAGPQHNAGKENVLNGGIIATLIDCHSICTAIATACRDAGTPIGADPALWYVTAGFELQYLAPADLSRPVRLTARVVEATAKRSLVTCELHSGASVCTRAKLTAVKVSPEWQASF